MAQDLQQLPDVGPRATRCFELCARTLIIQPDEIAREWTMIHGVTPHAWLASSDGMRVYDTLLNAYFPGADYLKWFECVEQRRYDQQQTTKLVASSGEYGPWHRDR